MKIKFNQKSQCKENRIRREIKELSEKQQTWDPERINARYTIINNNNSSLWSKQHLKSCKPTIAKKKKKGVHAPWFFKLSTLCELFCATSVCSQEAQLQRSTTTGW